MKVVKSKEWWLQMALDEGNSEVGAGFDHSRHGSSPATRRDKPVIILIGADNGGVGKTTVARTLLDYFGVHQTPVRAFDTGSPRGTLKRFHPDITEVVDVTSVADQMKIFDTLGGADSRVTVVDVRAGLLSSTLKALSEIGFIECAKKDQITFAVFHILGPSIASLDEIAEIARSVGNGSYFLVKNRINDTTFFEWDPATYNAYFKQIKDVAEINIPKLNEMACERVEVAGSPFVSFIANKTARDEKANYSFVLRGYVRHWLGNVWSEYDRLHLIDLVASSFETENEEQDMRASA
jgi:hypothetical protein